MFGVLNNIEAANPAPSSFSNWSVSAILGIILNIVIGVGFSLSIVGLAYSGIIYVTSSGDPKNARKAWDGFLWSAIAAMITLAAFVIKAVALNLFGVDTPAIRNEVPGF